MRRRGSGCTRQSRSRRPACCPDLPGSLARAALQIVGGHRSRPSVPHTPKLLLRQPVSGNLLDSDDNCWILMTTVSAAPVASITVHLAKPGPADRSSAGADVGFPLEMPFTTTGMGNTPPVTLTGRAAGWELAWRGADFSYWRWYKAANGPIAQLDRVTDFYSVGCRFESCWDRQLIFRFQRFQWAHRRFGSPGQKVSYRFLK